MDGTFASTLLEVGIDYITATTTARRTESSLDAFGSYLVDEQVREGHKGRTCKLRGYSGQAAGHAAWGRRYDGAYLRLSGSLAAAWWPQVVNLCENVSRIDLQVTVVPDIGPTRTLQKHHSQMRRRNKMRGRPAKWKVWSGPSGPEAIMLGKRISDRFGRVYDKGIESGVPRYAGALRYEVELKNALAWSMAQQLDSQPEEAPAIGAYVQAFMAVRITQLGWPWWPSYQSGPNGPSPENSCIVGASPMFPVSSSNNMDHIHRQLRWMAVQVTPAITRLVRAGFRSEVLTALGLCDE